MINRNPIFNKMNESSEVYYQTECSTYQGITSKTLILLATAIIAAMMTMFNIQQVGSLNISMGAVIVLGIVQMIAVMYSYTNLRATKICALIYAVTQGAMLGMITLLGELMYPGIALVAIVSTLVIFFVLLALFATGIIRNNSKLVSIGYTIGISLIVISLVFTLFTLFSTSFSNFVAANPMLMVFLTLGFLVYGAIMLLVDFSQATYYVQNGADKQYEWRIAFGLSITIIYIYIQVLRLLMILMSNRD